MESVTTLAARAGLRPRAIGGLLLFDADAARLFLQECRSSGTRVLGVEGFRVSGADVTPWVDAISDLSTIPDPAVSVAEAARFLDEMAGEGLEFDFTVTDETSP